MQRHPYSLAGVHAGSILGFIHHLSDPLLSLHMARIYGSLDCESKALTNKQLLSKEVQECLCCKIICVGHSQVVTLLTRLKNKTEVEVGKTKTLSSFSLVSATISSS